MGLDCHAKGLPRGECFHGSYHRYHMFLYQLIEVAYGKKYADIWHYNELNEETIEEWNKVHDENLDILLFHSDCDGKFNPQECRKVYNSIKDYTLEHISYVSGYPGRFPCVAVNTLDVFKRMFKHCWKNRVNLYYR